MQLQGGLGLSVKQFSFLPVKSSLLFSFPRVLYPIAQEQITKGGSYTHYSGVAVFKVN